MVLVLLSILDLIVDPPSLSTVGTSGRSGLSALRAFRMFRILRLARRWRTLRILMDVLGKTVSGVANFALLLALLVYIFTLCGMELFAGKFCFDPVTNMRLIGQDYADCRPLSNWDTFSYALMSCYQILTTENWNNVMYNGWRAIGWPAVLFFMIAMIIIHYIALSMYVAILLGNFQGSGLGKSDGGSSRLIASKQFVSRAIQRVTGVFVKKEDLKGSNSKDVKMLSKVRPAPSRAVIDDNHPHDADDDDAIESTASASGNRASSRTSRSATPVPTHMEGKAHVIVTYQSLAGLPVDVIPLLCCLQWTVKMMMTRHRVEKSCQSVTRMRPYRNTRKRLYRWEATAAR